MYMLLLLSVVVIALCACGIACVAEWVDERAERQAEDTIERDEDEVLLRERQKRAFYMSNFWNYDGTEQQEWDDCGV